MERLICAQYGEESVQSLLATNNFRLIFDQTNCTLQDVYTNLPIASGHLKSGLYGFSMNSELCQSPNRGSGEHTVAMAMSSSSTSAQLWHCRLAHVNMQRLKTISGSNLFDPVINFKDSPEFSCESCIFGKHHTLPHIPTGSTKASHLLELIHSDICGPMSTPSLGGALYFLTFIDDWSKHTTTYYLKHESEALQCFINYFHFAECQTGYKLHS